MATEEPTATNEEHAEAADIETVETEEEEFIASIRSAQGCVIEKDVPCDLHAAMSAEVVEWRRGRWHPTGDIVDNRRRWGVRVRFTYYGKLAACLAGKLKITAWWDGFSNLPEGHRTVYVDVDPCRRRHQYVVVVPVTALSCPGDEGVYDLAATLDFDCCDRTAIVLGHCDLEAIRVTC